VPNFLSSGAHSRSCSRSRLAKGARTVLESSACAVSPPPRALRFAVLCESVSLEAWQAKCLDLLLGSGCAQLVLLVTRSDFGQEARSSQAPGGIGARRRPLFWQLWHRSFTRRAEALRRVDCSSRMAFADRLACAVVKNGLDHESFCERDVATISSYRLDFILQFGFGALQGEILRAATYGVWSYDHDHERRLGGVPTCFWDVMRREPTTKATLRRLTEGPDRAAVLHTATFATERNFLRTYDQVALGSPEGCLHVCRAIDVGDEGTVESSVPSRTEPARRVPGNLEVLSVLFDQVVGYLRATFAKHFYRDEWNVGIVAQPIEALLKQGSLDEVTWLGPRNGRTYLADPIVFDQDNTRCRFLAECFDTEGSAKGCIVRCELERDGTFAISPFLEAEHHHLSYPFVLHHRDRSYLIPETHELGAILLYSINADGALAPSIRLLEGTHAVDPTVIWTNGRWWLFCSEGSLKLLAFHANALDGPWTPHRLNPLKIDVTSSRPAGPLFERDGMLLRPAQDCSTTYGAGVVLHRIVELTPERFHEERLGRIGPEPGGAYPKGFHTINVLNGHCLVDGKRTVFDPTWILRGWTHARKVRARRARLRAMPRSACGRNSGPGLIVVDQEGADGLPWHVQRR
jgi:hypothetical protein